ncbi:MAG: hypothetical protein RI955_1536 [Bacteroidota bacterium]
MKYTLLLIYCLFLSQIAYSQNPVNSFEIGISGDYFINKVKYKLDNMQHIRLPYFSFTRLIKKVYIRNAKKTKARSLFLLSLRLKGCNVKKIPC